MALVVHATGKRVQLYTYVQLHILVPLRTGELVQGRAASPRNVVPMRRARVSDGPRSRHAPTPPIPFRRVTPCQSASTSLYSVVLVGC
jgi:hypothetical protein